MNEKTRSEQQIEALKNLRVKKALKLLDPVFVFFCDTEHNMDHDPHLKQYFLDAKDCLKEAIDLLISNPKANE